MLRHLISMTYSYIYFNQFGNVLECYDRGAHCKTTCDFTVIITHTHTNSCLHRLQKGYEIKKLKKSYRSIQPCYLTSKFCTIINNQNIDPN